MTNNNSFCSPALQEINSIAEPIISSHIQALNNISNDIKALENGLKAAAIPFTFIYVVFSEKKEKYKKNSYRLILPDQNEPYEGDFIRYEDHCLVWGKNAENEYRLSYNLYVTDDEIEDLYYDEKVIQRIHKGIVSLEFSKPVIETKSYFRLKIENELPNFYKRIIECLKSKKAEDYIIEDSPNINVFVSEITARGLVS